MPLAPRARFWFDLAERVVMTFLQAFAAAWIVTDDLFTSTNLGIAATAGAIAAGKCLIAAKLGNNDDASALPAAVDPATAVNDPSNRAVAAAVTSAVPVSDQRTEHEKLAAMASPERPPELDGGTLKGFPSAKTPAKKAAATRR